METVIDSNQLDSTWRAIGDRPCKKIVGVVCIITALSLLLEIESIVHS